ncbi:unnamed protein product, partial [Phaeothamnion confervicola]
MLAASDRRLAECVAAEFYDPERGVSLCRRTGASLAVLRVVVVGGRDIPVLKRTTRGSDTFVALALEAGSRSAGGGFGFDGDCWLRTGVATDSLFPKWGEEFAIGPIPSVDARLRVMIVDFTSQRAIGGGTVALAPLGSHQRSVSLWCPIG